MYALRPIPKQLLNETMQVYEPTDDGGLSEPKTVRNVRFERTHEIATDAHRSDMVGGTVFVDATISEGAYEVPAGSRLEINGENFLVKSVTRLCAANGHVHHWELVVT